MQCTEKTVADLEIALEKQIRSLRGLLSSLSEEEEGYLEGNEEQIEEILERRLALFELFEKADAEARPLIHQYSVLLKKPQVKLHGIKAEELLDLRKTLSYEDIRLMTLVDQLITLVDKIHEKSHAILISDRQSLHSHNLALRHEISSMRKPKTAVGLLQSRRSHGEYFE